MAQVAIAFGREQVEVTVPDEKLVVGRRGSAAPAIADVPSAVRQALEAPREFPALRQALTPDDHVTVVLGDLGDLGELGEPGAPGVPGAREAGRRDVLLAVLECLLAAGLHPDAITLLALPGAPDSRGEVSVLADDFRGVRRETHDPTDRKKLAYLASTRAGRRVYLNRTLVDADQLIVLGTACYDPVLGYGGGLGEIFPWLSDEATRNEFLAKPSESTPGAKAWPARQEANEVGWLLGMPFLVQVIEGQAEEIAHVLAGAAGAVADEAHRLLDEHWRVTVDQSAELVVAGVSGRQTFANVTRALACAARVVRPGGKIVILSRAGGALGPSTELLRGADDPAQALARVRQQHLPDSTSAWQLATAARQAQLFLLSEFPAATVEELFTTPLEHAGQVRRLIEAADSCLFLPDAQRTLAVIAKDAAP